VKKEVQNHVEVVILLDIVETNVAGKVGLRGEGVRGRWEV